MSPHISPSHELARYDRRRHTWFVAIGVALSLELAALSLLAGSGHEPFRASRSVVVSMVKVESLGTTPRVLSEPEAKRDERAPPPVPAPSIPVSRQQPSQDKSPAKRKPSTPTAGATSVPQRTESAASPNDVKGAPDDSSINEMLEDGAEVVEAVSLSQVSPEIPASVRSQEYKSYVRAKVEISANGDSAASLKTSSGNAEVDRQVLEALEKWRLRPAMVNGRPVPSVKHFKFEFEVR
jgi:TonB family protein